MPYVTLKNGNRIEALDEFTGESKALEFDTENKKVLVDYGDGSAPEAIGGGMTPEQAEELDQAVDDIAQLKIDVARAESKADIAGEVANSKLDNSMHSHTEGTVPVADENGQLVDNYITNDNIATSAGIESSKLAFTSAQTSVLNSGIDATKVAQIQTNADNISLVDTKATHADDEATRISGLIPSEATTSNKLADKAFVNSSIATSTATFRGTFNSFAELEAYSGEKDENDYAFVAETSGSATVYKRYKYNGSAWVFEYELNNSSFTAAQWATINSGATASTVAQVETNRTNIVANSNSIDTLNASASTQGSVANKIATALPSAGDGNTIDANSNDKLEAIGLLNANGGAPIKVWEGSESAWENGETNDWFGWSNTSMTATVDNDRLPSAMPTGYTQMIYGTSRLFCISNKNTYYSDDNGATWNTGGVIQGGHSADNPNHFMYHNGTFFAINWDGEVWSCAESSSEWTYLGWASEAYVGKAHVEDVACNDDKLFILFSSSTTTPYARLLESSDNGTSWSAVSSSVLDALPTRVGGGANIDAFGDVILITYLNQSIYSSDNGATWQSNGDIAGGSIPNNINWKLMHTPSGRFIADYIGNIVYSDDNGVTWQEGAAFPKTTAGSVMKDLNGTLVIGDGNRFYRGDYNLTSWTLVYTLPSNTHCRYPAVCGDKLIGCVEQTRNMLTLANTTSVLYTDSTTVTSKSPVYSAPKIVSSEYKITYQIGNTLNVTDLATQNFVEFTRDSQSDQTTTSSIGDIHPDWLCNIENVGVKFGNRLIADASGSLVVDQVYDATSVNAQSGVAIAGAGFASSGDLTSAINNLATVARTGSYNDLIDKPAEKEIPTVDNSDFTVAASGWSANTDSATSTAFPYKADLPAITVNQAFDATDTGYNVSVSFDPASAVSGKLAGFCTFAIMVGDTEDTSNITVTIYSSDNTIAPTGYVTVMHS